MALPPDIAASRALFPRGLRQPPGSFRFSEDALLLAAFILRRCLPLTSGRSLLDLGCGCGVVGLACLLGDEGLACLGADCVPELAQAARDNARALGLASRYAARVLDLASPEARMALPEGSFSLVAANMPYRPSGSGRLPRSGLRQKALIADEGTMPAFLRGAARALAPGGLFALVYPWEAKDALFSGLEAQGFSLRLLLPLSAREGRATRCLVAAGLGRSGGQSGGRSGERAVPEPPLVLRARSGKEYGAEAVAFCPWLASRPWGEPF
ncbi:MAG: methyltransferase domain-containing protein [Deltaproteobacteria bacterium]|jgi:tRNA1(Val) A37 N6-methylase TrmN6|nr:methyltransferase domain-containing protein [Deltaproteobacteria bacterium]